MGPPVKSAVGEGAAPPEVVAGGSGGGSWSAPVRTATSLGGVRLEQCAAAADPMEGPGPRGPSHGRGSWCPAWRSGCVALEWPPLLSRWPCPGQRGGWLMWSRPWRNLLSRPAHRTLRDCLTVRPGDLPPDAIGKERPGCVSSPPGGCNQGCPRTRLGFGDTRGGAGSAHRSGTHAGAGTPFPVLSSHLTYWVPTRARRHPLLWTTRAMVGPAGAGRGGPGTGAECEGGEDGRRGDGAASSGLLANLALLLLLEHVDLLMGCGVFRLLHGPVRTPHPHRDLPLRRAAESPQIGPFPGKPSRATLPRWPARTGRGRPPSWVGPDSVTGSGRHSRLPVTGRWAPCSSAVTRASARPGSSGTSAPTVLPRAARHGRRLSSDGRHDRPPDAAAYGSSPTAGRCASTGP